MELRAVLAGLAFAFMWSSAFTSARIIVADASPLWVAIARYLIAGALGVGIAYAMGQRPNLTGKQWRAVVVFGICQNALYLGLFFVAMQTIEASLAAIIASAMPLLVGLALALQGEQLGRLGWVGLIAGFAGVLLIMGSRIGAGVDLMGVFICIIGVSALAYATMTVKNATTGGNFLMVVGLQMWVGAAALLLPAILFDPVRLEPSWTLALAFGYTVLFPGLIATVIWFWLVTQIGATRAATYHFLNPFFGVVIAWALLNERLGTADIVGVVIVALGILAVQLSRQKT